MHEKFEASIFENPDDVASWNAYADWLMEQGDPRGEFMQVQLALEDENLETTHRQSLQKREQELLEEHQRAWLGELSFLIDHPWPEDDFLEEYQLCCRFGHARGWLSSLELSLLTPQVNGALIRSPEVRFVRSLSIREVSDGKGDIDGTDRLSRIIDVSETMFGELAQGANFDNLRHFSLGWSRNEDTETDEYVCLEDPEEFLFGAEKLIASMPRLETLGLFVLGVNLSTLFSSRDLTQLRELRVYHGHSRHSLDQLAKNDSFPSLTHLILHPATHYVSEDEVITVESNPIPLSAVREFVRSRYFPNLTHLQLRLSPMGDEGVRAIVESGILKRLKMLDLNHGCITDEGARMLADCPDLTNLEILRLNRNGLTEVGMQLIYDQFGDEDDGLSIEDQQTPEEQAVHSYLYECTFE